MTSIIEQLELVKQTSQEQTASSQALSEQVTGTLASLEAKASEAANAVHTAMNTMVHIHSQTGNDALGDGTASSPYRTIKKAIESQPDHITLYVAGDTGDAQSPHLIDVTIKVKSRTVIFYNLHHIRYGAAIIFDTDPRGMVIIGDAYGGAQVKSYVSSDVIIMAGSGGIFLGGYMGHSMKAENDPTITLLKQSYTALYQPLIACCSRFNIYNADASAFTGIFKVLEVNYAGCCMYRLHQCTLGANFDDTAHSALNGDFKAVSL